MAVGLASSFANQILNLFRATNITAPATIYVKLHTDVGDPGSAGTSNPSANTTRNAVTFAAPSAGSMALSSLAPWTMTTSETIKFISFWDASTAGTFLQSAQLTTPVPVINGSTLTVNSLTASYSPIAA